MICYFYRENFKRKIYLLVLNNVLVDFNCSTLVAQLVKNPPDNAGDPSLIPGLGRSPGGGYGSPLQYSYLENPHGQRSLGGYSPWGCKESDMIEQLSTARTFN